MRSLCGSSIPVLLVGCKKDLRDQGGPEAFVTTEQVRATSAGAAGQREREWNGAAEADLFGDGARRQGQRMALEIGAKAYNECSALMNEGVDDVFEKATRLSMLSRADGEVKPPRGGRGKVVDNGNGAGSSSSPSGRRKSSSGRDGGGCGCVIV